MMPAEDHTYVNNNTQAQIDMQTSHSEFNVIIWEKKNMKSWKNIWEMSVKNKEIWN